MREESKKLVFTVATVIAITLVAQVMHPDNMKLLTMKSARKVQKIANKGALGLLNVADYAEGVYERQRL